MSLLHQSEITSSKVLFPEHFPLSRIQTGIKSGSFLQGTFRASRDNYLEATVFVQGEGEDSTEVCVFVCMYICLWIYSSVDHVVQSKFVICCANNLIFQKSESMLKALYGPFICSQVLIQGLQNLNRAVHQDVVAVQLLPRSEWVAPSSVVLQDEGTGKDDEDAEEEEGNVSFMEEDVIRQTCIFAYGWVVCFFLFLII